MVGTTDARTAGYGNMYSIFSTCQSTDWWVDTGANIHVCADMSLFSSYQVTRGGVVLMGNGSRASVHGVGTVDMKLTSGKFVHLQNVQHVPGINKTLISDSLLCRDGFKLVFESNKLVISRYGQFIGKGYDSGGMVCLSLSDFSNSVVNNVNRLSNDDEVNIWHSRLCHINFRSISPLSILSLIPKLPIVKGSKCQACVQAKQPRKPHFSVEERDSGLLELIHSDLCKMNGVLTKWSKKYMMTFIDDATCFCYVYLLKSKDEALDFFKIYKADVENLGRLNSCGLIEVENIYQTSSLNSMSKME